MESSDNTNYHIAKKHKIEKDICYWDELPIELTEFILSFTLFPPMAISDLDMDFQHKYHKIFQTFILCFVCQQWKELLPRLELELMCAPILCGFFAKMGILSLLQWARKLGVPWNEDTCANAARAGQLDVLKWAKKKQRDGDQNSRICANAAKGG